MTLRWGRVSHCRTYGTPVKTAIGKDTWFAEQCSKKQNFVRTRVSDWHKSDTTGTRFVPRVYQAHEFTASLNAPNHQWSWWASRKQIPNISPYAFDRSIHRQRQGREDICQLIE